MGENVYGNDPSFDEMVPRLPEMVPRLMKWSHVCLKWSLVCLKWSHVWLKWSLVCLKWSHVCLKWSHAWYFLGKLLKKFWLYLWPVVYEKIYFVTKFVHCCCRHFVTLCCECGYDFVTLRTTTFSLFHHVGK